MAYSHRHERRGRVDRSWHIQVVVGNTDRRIIDWIGDRWEGYLAVVSRAKYEQKDMHWFTASGRRLVPVLTAAWPYLVAKADQADLAFQFLAARPAHPGRPGYTAEQRARMDEICERMRELNRKGTKPRGRRRDEPAGAGDHQPGLRAGGPGRDIEGVAGQP